jgi:hypothetical protein
MAWNGYRVPKIGGGGSLNGYVAPKAKQEWAIGSIVNIGFVKGLTVLSKTNGIFNLIQASTGRAYTFEPHMGLSRV